MRFTLTPAPARVVAVRAVLILGFATAFAIASRPEAVQRAARLADRCAATAAGRGAADVDAPEVAPTRPDGGSAARLLPRRGASGAPEPARAHATLLRPAGPRASARQRIRAAIVDPAPATADSSARGAPANSGSSASGAPAKSGSSGTGAPANSGSSVGGPPANSGPSGSGTPPARRQGGAAHPRPPATFESSGTFESDG